MCDNLNDPFFCLRIYESWLKMSGFDEVRRACRILLGHCKKVMVSAKGQKFDAVLLSCHKFLDQCLFFKTLRFCFFDGAFQPLLREKLRNSSAPGSVGWLDDDRIAELYALQVGYGRDEDTSGRRISIQIEGFPHQMLQHSLQ